MRANIICVLFLTLISFRAVAQEKIPYDLDHPSASYTMPSELSEISGIHYTANNGFASIQDEEGKIFFFDPKVNKITQTIRFDKDKDYEDIEIVGEDVYILESDGDIRLVPNFMGNNPKAIVYETSLSRANDTEGMCYHQPSHSLLIACKGDASLDPERPMKAYRAVYRFDLKTMKLFASPVMLININDLMDYSSLNAFARLSYKLAAMMDQNGDIRFQPSAIAIHPQSKNIYILSFTSTILAVYAESGALLYVKNLNKKLFAQPEGMCFDPQGNLYISNEANGGKADILKFNRLNE